MPEDFLWQVRNAPKGSVIIFDEAFRGLSSKATRSKVNKAIVEALMEVRQRSLTIFIVLPTIFLLEIYAAVFRSEALFHIYKSRDGKRCYKIYNYEKKKQLYLRGKSKYFSYAKPKIKKMKGRFLIKKTADFSSGIPYETFDNAGYLKKKEEAFRQNGQKEEPEETKYQKQRDLIIKNLYKTTIKSYRKLSEWLEAAGVRLSHAQVGEIVGKDGNV